MLKTLFTAALSPVPIDHSQTLGRRPGDFPVAERIGHETISLPFYPTMPEEYIGRVAATLRGIAERVR